MRLLIANIYFQLIFYLTHIMPLVSFYNPPKTLENYKFSNVFRGYRKESVACHRLIRERKQKKSSLLAVFTCFTKKIIEIFMSIYSCIVATILMQHLYFLKKSYTVKMNNFYPLLTFANMKKKVKENINALELLQICYATRHE